MGCMILMGPRRLRFTHDYIKKNKKQEEEWDWNDDDPGGQDGQDMSCFGCKQSAEYS